MTSRGASRTRRKEALPPHDAFPAISISAGRARWLRDRWLWVSQRRRGAGSRPASTGAVQAEAPPAAHNRCEQTPSGL